jgi:hypothetical protein
MKDAAPGTIPGAAFPLSVIVRCRRTGVVKYGVKKGVKKA